MVDGVRYHKALSLAKTKVDAETEKDLIVAKIRHGEFEYIKDKTKFSDFVDKIYLPYCEINNDNYNTKIYETNSLKTFFGNLLLKAITQSKIEEFIGLYKPGGVYHKIKENAAAENSRIEFRLADF